MRVPRKLVKWLSRDPNALVPMEPLGKTYPSSCLREAFILVWEGFPPLEAQGKALAYLAWGSLSAAKREETVPLLPSSDIEALAVWFYEHREESYCWWRTRYKKGKPRMKVDYFGSSTGIGFGWRIPPMGGQRQRPEGYRQGSACSFPQVRRAHPGIA